MKMNWRIVRKALLLTASGLLLAGGLSSAQVAADNYRQVWNDDPATTMTVGCCQDRETVHYLRYGTSADLADLSIHDVGTISELSNTVHGTHDVLKSYFVDLTNLTADTPYYFQVCEEFIHNPGQDNSRVFIFYFSGIDLFAMNVVQHSR